jgi:hypothetical protein
MHYWYSSDKEQCATWRLAYNTLEFLKSKGRASPRKDIISRQYSDMSKYSIETEQYCFNKTPPKVFVNKPISTSVHKFVCPPSRERLKLSQHRTSLRILQPFLNHTERPWTSSNPTEIDSKTASYIHTKFPNEYSTISKTLKPKFTSFWNLMFHLSSHERHPGRWTGCCSTNLPSLVRQIQFHWASLVLHLRLQHQQCFAYLRHFVELRDFSLVFLCFLCVADCVSCCCFAWEKFPFWIWSG